jgi:glucose-6-phosphate isomerase
MKHLQELTDHVKDNVDVVVSLGIGGSYLGDKVLFDVHCGEFWNACRKKSVMASRKSSSAATISIRAGRAISSIIWRTLPRSRNP